MLNTNLIIKLFYKPYGNKLIFNHKKYNKFILNIQHYSNIKKYLDNVYIDSNSYIETIYRLFNNINKAPICPICGSKIQLTYKSHIYFPKTCSLKCSHNLTVQINKIVCMERYGVDNPAKSEKAKQQYKETCLKKYGVDAFYKSQEYKEKSKQTCLKHYGVDNILKLKNIHDKGVKCSKNKNVCEKRNNTILEKYGVNNISQSKEIKDKKEKTFINHYGYKNNFCNKEVQLKCNNESGKQKRYNTMKNNGTFNKSKYEDQSYELLKEKYPDVIRQYKSELYPFNCDFYIPSLDLYIECQYSQFHHGRQYLGTEEDLKDIELLKEKANKCHLETGKNKSRYDAEIYTWSDLDVRKRNIIKQNNLNYIEFWTVDECKKWLNK